MSSKSTVIAGTPSASSNSTITQHGGTHSQGEPLKPCIYVNAQANYLTGARLKNCESKHRLTNRLLGACE